MNLSHENSWITGMGIITPIGIGLSQFSKGLKVGVPHFSYIELEHQGRHFTYPVAKPLDVNPKAAIAELPLDQNLIQKARGMRNLSESALWGLYCALEAWADSGLHHSNVDSQKIAIVCGGSNTQEASLNHLREKYHTKIPYLNPVYGMQFFDTDLVGIISEVLDVHGESYSIGAASASGNMVLIHAHRLVTSGDYDVVLAIAPLMELSIYQYQSFTALGAMALASVEKQPNMLCRPFDSDHAGFVYGQNAGCMILENLSHAQKRQKDAFASVVGYGIALDGNRNPNPSVKGEKKAMQQAINRSGINAEDIDYVNMHGTASPTGDKTEVEACLQAGLEGIKANSSKSLIGHGLSAAGLVEGITCCIQIKDGFLHPNLNLDNPITDKIDWVDSELEKAQVNYALSNSFGFGGINTSIVLKNI